MAYLRFRFGNRGGGHGHQQQGIFVDFEHGGVNQPLGIPSLMPVNIAVRIRAGANS